MTRVSRRQWLSGTGALALSLLEHRPPARGDAPILMGSGAHRYEWVSSWAGLPGGVDYGNTHGGIVIDEAERLYFSRDPETAVLMFDLEGRYLGTWGDDLTVGLHGMAIAKSCGGRENLYLAHTGRHEVIQTELDGTVVKILPFPQSSGAYSSKDQYKPTGVAIAPNGNIYVGDGYGLGWIHQYDPAGGYVRSWGGPGSKEGQFNTPHGIWVDTRSGTPLVVVADRENLRLQWFDLDGKFVKALGGFRRPCGFHQSGTDLVVPQLAGRVTILDKDDQVVTHLGDNPNESQRAQNGVDKPDWKDGIFIAPHSARWDRDGNLYVMDWNFRGRVNKLRRVD